MLEEQSEMLAQSTTVQNSEFPDHSVEKTVPGNGSLGNGVNGLPGGAAA